MVKCHPLIEPCLYSWSPSPMPPIDSKEYYKFLLESLSNIAENPPHTPHSLKHTLKHALATIISNSPYSQKQQELFNSLYSLAEYNLAAIKIAVAGEQHL